MEGKYEIFFNKRSVGTAEVKKEGLYYHFYCQCCLPENEIYHIIFACGSSEYSLGICVPMEGCFGVSKRLAIKSVENDVPHFYVRNKHHKSEYRFVPVSKDHPFHYIEQMEKAYFDEQDGTAGLCIPVNQSGI